MDPNRGSENMPKKTSMSEDQPSADIGDGSSSEKNLLPDIEPPKPKPLPYWEPEGMPGIILPIESKGMSPAIIEEIVNDIKEIGKNIPTWKPTQPGLRSLPCVNFTKAQAEEYFVLLEQSARESDMWKRVLTPVERTFPPRTVEIKLNLGNPSGVRKNNLASNNPEWALKSSKPTPVEPAPFLNIIRRPNATTKKDPKNIPKTATYGNKSSMAPVETVPFLNIIRRPNVTTKKEPQNIPKTATYGNKSPLAPVVKTEDLFNPKNIIRRDLVIIKRPNWQPKPKPESILPLENKPLALRPVQNGRANSKLPVNSSGQCHIPENMRALNAIPKKEMPNSQPKTCLKRPAAPAVETIRPKVLR